MKVAICLPALMRTYEKLYQNHLEKLIEPNQADVFVYTSNYNDQLDTHYQIEDFTQRIKSVYGESLKGINVVTNERIEAEMSGCEIRANMDAFYSGARKRRNDWINFYRTMKCNEMVKSYEEETGTKYDVVVKFRPDLHLDKKLDLKDVDIRDDFLYTFSPTPYSEWTYQDYCNLCHKDFGDQFLKESFYKLGEGYLVGSEYINTPFLNMFVFASRAVFQAYSQTYTHFGTLSLDSATEEGSKKLLRTQEYQIKLHLQNNGVQICNILEYPSTIVREKGVLDQPLTLRFNY